MIRLKNKIQFSQRKCFNRIIILIGPGCEIKALQGSASMDHTNIRWRSSADSIDHTNIRWSADSIDRTNIRWRPSASIDYTNIRWRTSASIDYTNIRWTTSASIDYTNIRWITSIVTIREPLRKKDCTNVKYRDVTTHPTLATVPSTPLNI